MSELTSRLKELSSRAHTLRDHLDLETKEARLHELQEYIAAPDLWDDPQRATKLTQEASRLEQLITSWSTFLARIDDAVELADLLDEGDDQGVIDSLEHEADAIEGELGKRELDLLFSAPYSDSPALLTVHAGAGGTDSQDWASMLFRMFVRWGESHGMHPEIIDETEGEEAGIKSATVRMSGDRAYGLLRSEKGVHRLVRLSPFDSAHRRHTSFALVEVMPEIEDEAPLDIDPDDVRVDLFRSSGAGGQHVNKTSSAVRLTHIPTGTVVTCQNERSQGQNREMAWRVLRSRLRMLQEEARAQTIADIKGDVVSAEWGNQIRSYVLHPYMLVKDHRTNVEVGNTQDVLEGNIDPFIEAFLRYSVGGASSGVTSMEAR
ncbi:MAG: peptide chain release factor 2 [Candidatus Dormibacteria bacterium]